MTHEADNPVRTTALSILRALERSPRDPAYAAALLLGPEEYAAMSRFLASMAESVLNAAGSAREDKHACQTI